MRIPLILAAALATGLTAPAAARDGDTVSIATDRYDLTTVSGRAQLNARIQGTVRRACQIPSPALHARATERDCRDRMLADMLRQADQAIARAGSGPVQIASAGRAMKD